MSYKLSRAERETIIRRAEDEEGWTVYSAIERDKTRIRRAAAAFGRDVTVVDHDAIRATLPVEAITFRASKGQKGVSGNADALRAYRESRRAALVTDADNQE